MSPVYKSPYAHFAEMSEKIRIEVGFFSLILKNGFEIPMF